MNPFKSFTLKWWQTGLLKLSMISLGIILGIYWQGFFHQWIVIVTIVFIVPALYLVRVWWEQ
jgi:hypothetical protein